MPGLGEADVKELLELGTATLGESGASRMVDAPMPMWAGAALAGPARPIRCTPGDNLGVHVGVTAAVEGEVLVVDVGSAHGFGYWGEVLTVAAQARRLAGLVIGGCVRDVDAIESRRFPVFARGTALPGARKEQAATIDHPVEFGGVTITPGDWVIADRDGIVVVPADRITDVLDAARARTEREVTIFRALQDGATTVELLGLDVGPVERS
jgi:4-hydroxy-4-methyl-2-oxoglutarate aldolase